MAARGAATYQGKPCKRGHVGIRRVKGGGACIDCQRERGSRINATLTDEQRAAKQVKDREYGRAWRAKLSFEDRHARHLKKKYGLSKDAYQVMSEGQNYCCAICKTAAQMEKSGRLAVDHDHDTGKVRGLLCARCNMGLGLFSEAKNRLLSAVEYLEIHCGNG